MKRTLAVICAVSSMALVFVSMSVYAQTSSAPPERTLLEGQIKDKADALEKINKELSATQKNLNETKAERMTLQKEVSSIDANIKQLNLNIQADTIAADKLRLEIQSITLDIDDIRDGVQVKKNSIAQIIRTLQRRDDESLLISFLKHDTLAEGVREAQGLSELNGQLAKDIRSLIILEQELGEKADGLSNRQVQIEARKANAQNRKQIVGDQRSLRQTLITQTKNKESTYEQQVEELRKEQQKIADEIEKIEVELRKKIDPNLLPLARPGVLAWPVRGGRVSQEYGSTAFALRNYRGKHHNGVDIAAPIGTEVLAAEKGKVINVGDQDRFCPRGAYGKFVVVKHENGLTTLYGHLSRYSVAIGQSVEEGNVVGYVGRTGYATGPHLHLVVFATNTITPAREGFPEGTKASASCGPMPVGGDLNPMNYLAIPQGTGA